MFSRSLTTMNGNRRCQVMWEWRQSLINRTGAEGVSVGTSQATVQNAVKQIKEQATRG